MSNASSQLCAEACALVPDIISQAKSVGIALSYPDAYKCALDTVKYNVPAAGQSSAPPAQAGGLTIQDRPLAVGSWQATDRTTTGTVESSLPNKRQKTGGDSTTIPCKTNSSMQFKDYIRLVRVEPGIPVRVSLTHCPTPTNAGLHPVHALSHRPRRPT